MEERVFGDDYCDGVYHGRLDNNDMKYRLEKFEDNWYIADGTGNVDAVILIDKHTSISISDFYPDARITVHLFVIENLRQGAAEVRDEKDDHVAGLQKRILELQRDNQCHLENEVKYLDEIDTIQASYDKIIQMQKGAVVDFLDLRKSNMAEAKDYQEEIDDLEEVLEAVKRFNADLAEKLTQARCRYNDLFIKCSETQDILQKEIDQADKDNIDLDKRNMGLIARCTELEEEGLKQDKIFCNLSIGSFKLADELSDLKTRYDNVTINKCLDNCSPGMKVELKWAYEQYKKVQEYVLAKDLQMGHADDASHAEILIEEHKYLVKKMDILKSTEFLRG
jgi:hypothetical protein